MKTKREHFEHFHIAGFAYYEGALVFDKLKIGTKLKLVAEPTNAFDKNAVEIYLDDTKLGYVPRTFNREISKLLNAGYDIFSVYVQMVNPVAKPEEQVMAIVYLERKQK
jgi:hypothetical protein